MPVHPGQVAVEFIDGEPPNIDRKISRAGGGRNRTYLAEAAQLRERAGQWAILRRQCPAPDVAGKVAESVRRGMLAAFRPAGSFEAVSRTVDGEYRVYARCVKESPL